MKDFTDHQNQYNKNFFLENRLDFSVFIVSLFEKDMHENIGLILEVLHCYQCQIRPECLVSPLMLALTIYNL